MDKRFAKLLGLSEESQKVAQKLMAPSKDSMETLGIEDQGSDEANSLAMTQKITDMMGGVSGSIKNVGQKALNAAEGLAAAPANKFGKLFVKETPQVNPGKVIRKMTDQELADETMAMLAREKAKLGK